MERLGCHMKYRGGRVRGVRPPPLHQQARFNVETRTTRLDFIFTFTQLSFRTRGDYVNFTCSLNYFSFRLGNLSRCRFLRVTDQVKEGCS